MDPVALLTDLIGTIYDAGLGAEAWSTVLERIGQMVGADGSAFYVDDHQKGAFEVLSLRGYPASAANAYMSYFVTRDVRRPVALALPTHSVYVDDRHMAFADVARSEIFNDFYRPARLEGHSIATLPFKQKHRFAVLSVHRSVNASSFDPVTIAMFGRLSPHIARAVQLQRQIARANLMSEGLATALDHFGMAVLLCDGAGRMVEMNAAADSLLTRPECPLRLTGSGVTAVASADASALKAAIAAAAGVFRGKLTAPPPVLRLAKTDGSGMVGLMAVPAHRTDIIAPGRERLVLLFVSDPVRTAPTTPELLMSQFGLSAAEALVAVQLANGDRVDDISGARGVSRETVRAQVKSILSKMGANGQSQLIGLISRSLAAFQRSFQ